MKRPVILVSTCLGFAACRWNGQVIPDDFVEALRPWVEYVPVCAEVEIGLGVPREPVRIVRTPRGDRLVQPATGRDCTEAMRSFGDRFFRSAPPFDGALLKSRSPSCGIKDVKVYAGPERAPQVDKTAGMFAAALAAYQPDVPAEDEGRLTNAAIRDHFLRRVFCMARFREAAAAGKMADLVRFHAFHKLLLMTHSESTMRAMGRLVATNKKRTPHEVFQEYGRMLVTALARPPRESATVNVLHHAFGYVSDRLSSAEKQHFLASVERYREERLPLSALLTLLQSWIARFSVAYLADQVFFRPYPAELDSVVDSGR